jgi:hypothetical protein
MHDNLHALSKPLLQQLEGREDAHLSLPTSTKPTETNLTFLQAGNCRASGSNNNHHQTTAAALASHWFQLAVKQLYCALSCCCNT